MTSHIEYRDPVFQAFTVKTTRAQPQHQLAETLRAGLGAGWSFRNYAGQDTYFEVFAKEGQLTPAEAWEHTYQLRTQQGIAYAEPVFKAWITDRRDWGINVGETGGEGEAGPFPAAGITDLLCGPGLELGEAEDVEWSLELSGVVQAWAAHFSDQVDPGSGVRIGHPDTGYRRHPEVGPNLLPAQGFDLFRNDDNPEDQLSADFPWQNPGHGTSTGSVIVSPRGAATNSQVKFVSGVAPGAELIPFRVSDTVIIVDSLNLARAIERAVDADAHVISISMGGLGSERLHDAIVYAKNRGVIVLAAAGNCVGFVVFPAAYEEVVAVAACDARKDIWQGSSRGNAVDVTAPGDRVWVARADLDDNLSVVGQSSGTSFAVATVAGIAALWLAKHGRDTIVRACGGEEKVASAFLQLLRSTATPQPGWPVGEFGGGLVAADKLLGAPLPDGTVTPALAPTAEENATLNRGGGATFAHLFETAIKADSSGSQPRAFGASGSSYDQLGARLSELLNTSQDKLPVDLGQIGQELAFHLSTDPALYRRFRDAVTAGPVDAGEDTGRRSEDTRDISGNVREVRERLLRRGVSRALAFKLGK